MSKISIAGLDVDAISKRDLLDAIVGRIKAGKTTFITTLYSEFLFAALKDRKVLAMLNTADIAVADGIGIFWAARFLQLPLTVRWYYGKIIQAIGQVIYSGASILLYPKFITSILPEKIVGADLIWDLARVASEHGWSIYMLGGFGDTAEIAARKLKEKFPTLIIAGTSTKNPDDSTALQDIADAKPDMVLVAYGPIRQETWIASHKDRLPAKLYIGLGGTFDYIAGKRKSPPRLIRSVGLEWLYRLITQPYRFRRIANGTVGLISLLVKYKVFSHLPYRKNAASVVLNADGEILIARYNPNKQSNGILGYAVGHFENFWQLPQGGLEEGENWEQGAQRELLEETGIGHVQTLFVSKGLYRYAWSYDRKLMVAKRYRFHGQEQSLVYFYYTGDNSDIRLDKDELLEYAWVPWQTLPERLNKQKEVIANIAYKEISEGLVKLP